MMESMASLPELLRQWAARSPERRRAFATAGRARVEACFTLDRMVADYAREYQRLERH